MAGFDLTKGFKEFAQRMLGAKATPAELAKINAKIDELETQRDTLIKRRDEIALTLRETIEFEQILPDKDNKGLHEQLIANERVHKLDHPEELLEKRLGGSGDNKRCFARVTRNGPAQLTAGIFTALIDLSAHADDLSYADIPGNINEIKNLPISAFEKNENTKTVAAILYTISSAKEHPWDKGGRPLAKAVYEYLNAEAAEQGYKVIVSTLSPIRNILTWLHKQDGFGFILDASFHANSDFLALLESDKDRAYLERKVIEYLLLEDDPVLNFHLGNGAYIGDIKFNPDNKIDPIMINYVYPQSVEQLEKNAEFYKESNIRLMAPHLLQRIGTVWQLQQKAASINAGEISQTLENAPAPHI